MPNYSSVKEHADFARAKFEEDVREGLMAKMSMGEFLEGYGEHTAIAALAIIVEDEEVDKKRVIHDATHGVRVNHRIRCRDKLRSPGAREKKHLLREHKEEGETALNSLSWATSLRPTAATSTRLRSTATRRARSTLRKRCPETPLARPSTSTSLGPSGSLALATGGPASRRVGLG